MMTIPMAAATVLGVGIALASLSAAGQAVKDAKKQQVMRLSPEQRYQEGLNF